MSDDEKPKKANLLEWLNPASNDFLGSGMTLTEWLTYRSIVDFQMSWTNQDRREKKRRLHFITEMTLEMRRIQQEYGNCLEGTWYVAAGAFMESAIEAVIAGDKKELTGAKEMYEPEFFRWNYDDEQGNLWAGRYARFVELCQQCLDTWPTEGETIRA